MGGTGLSSAPGGLSEAKILLSQSYSSVSRAPLEYVPKPNVSYMEASEGLHPVPPIDRFSRFPESGKAEEIYSKIRPQPDISAFCNQ